MTLPSTPHDRTAFRQSLHRDAYPEPATEPAIRPDLVNPHEPGPECGDTHCWGHDLDEPREDVWRTCSECKHAYRSPEELQREWVASAPPDIRDEPAPPVAEIFFCPLCLHDW